MKQVLIGGFYDALHATTIEYNVISGGDYWNTDVVERAGTIPTSGTLKNLRVELNDTPGGGTKTYTFTLHRAVGVGGFANTALTCTVASGATQASDMVNEVAVAAGDVVSLECDPTDSPTARYAKWTMVFEGDTANESILLTNCYTNLTTTIYSRPGGGIDSETENNVRCVCPTAGTIKNLYVWLQLDPGTDPDAYRFTLRKGGASQTLTCTITANARTGNDVAHDVAVIAGDVLTIMIEPLNSPTGRPYVAIGMVFLADTDGESIILGGSSLRMDDTDTVYNILNGRVDADWTVTEAATYQLAQECTLKKLYVLLNDSPGAGKDYTFTVRRDAGSPASGLVVEIADAATTGNDTAHTITVVDDNELDLMVVPTGTPTRRWAFWGLVGFISPIVGWTGKISGVTNPAKIMGVEVANIKSVKGVE